MTAVRITASRLSVMGTMPVGMENGDSTHISAAISAARTMRTKMRCERLCFFMCFPFLLCFEVKDGDYVTVEGLNHVRKAVIRFGSVLRAEKNTHLGCFFLVRVTAIEPAQPCDHKNLNLARLPVPPYPLFRFS